MPFHTIEIKVLHHVKKKKMGGAGEGRSRRGCIEGEFWGGEGASRGKEILITVWWIDYAITRLKKENPRWEIERRDMENRLPPPFFFLFFLTREF